MKKILAIALILILALTLTACGGSSNKKNIVGTWQIVDVDTATEYGLGLEFKKDGKMSYGLTEEMLASFAGTEISAAEWDDAMKGLDLLMNIKYKIKSDTEMEITVSAMLGLAKESTTVSYSLDGDTLIFDGATFTRVK